MPKVLIKIAHPIVITGLFAIVIIMALNYEALNLNFYIVFFLLSIFIFLFGFATGQRFASPIKKLLEAADELTKGNLQSRFYLESRDELGDLAATFNKIAEKLEESREEIEKTERSTDLRVKAKTRLLEETINALEQKVKNRTIEAQKMSAELEKLREEFVRRDKETIDLKNQMTEMKIKNK